MYRNSLTGVSRNVQGRQAAQHRAKSKIWIAAKARRTETSFHHLGWRTPPFPWGLQIVQTTTLTHHRRRRQRFQTMSSKNGAGSNGRSDDDVVDDGAAAENVATNGGHAKREQQQEEGLQEEETPSQFQSLIQRDLQTHSLDSYPYAFSPLLLFTSNGYFDKGHSNYNAVAAFFEGALSDLLRGGKGGRHQDGRGDDGDLGGEEEDAADGNADGSGRAARRDIDMLEGVVYDRKNMT